MTSRDDMAGLVAELRKRADKLEPLIVKTHDRSIGGHPDQRQPDGIWRELTDALTLAQYDLQRAADSLTSRSMEAGECEHCSGHGMVGRPLDDDPGRICDECKGSGRAAPNLSPVPGEGVTDEMVERAAKAIVRATGGDPEKLVYDNESGLGELLPWWRWEINAARAALTAALSPPVKGKE